MLTDKEIDVVESVLGVQKVFLFTKTWDERNALQPHKETAERCFEVCKGSNRKELLYWETKLEEMKIVDGLQTKVIFDTVKELHGKIDPELFEKCTVEVGLFFQPCRFGGFCLSESLYEGCVKDERMKNNWMCERDGLLHVDRTPKEVKRRE